MNQQTQVSSKKSEPPRPGKLNMVMFAAAIDHPEDKTPKVIEQKKADFTTATRKSSLHGVSVVPAAHTPATPVPTSSTPKLQPTATPNLTQDLNPTTHATSTPAPTPPLSGGTAPPTTVPATDTASDPPITIHMQAPNSTPKIFPVASPPSPAIAPAAPPAASGPPSAPATTPHPLPAPPTLGNGFTTPSQRSPKKNKGVVSVHDKSKDTQATETGNPFEIQKDTDFWICNRTDTKIELPQRDIRVYDLKNGVADENVPSRHFVILPPCETRFGRIEKQGPRNTFTVCFRPQAQGHMKGQVVLTFYDRRDSSFVDTVKFTVSAKCDWMLKLGTQPIAAQMKDISFPLRFIPDKWHLVKDELMEPKKGKLAGEDIEMTTGLHACLSALKDIFFYDDETWVEERERVEVGLTKETQDCGNSSVSMGLAAAFFKLKENKGKRYVAFVNCGTGGAKFQLYGKPDLDSPKRITVLGEIKPGKAALSNICPVGNYYPEGFLRRQSLEEVQVELVHGLQHAPWKQAYFLNALTEQMADISELHDIKPYAFVTGSIRNHWEKASDDMKEEMENTIQELFGTTCLPVTQLLGGRAPAPGEKRCFFLTQGEEGEMEFMGCRSMQKAVDHVLDRRGQARYDPVACLGIGSGSSQFTIFSNRRKKKSKFTVISYQHGMKSTAELRKLGKHIVASPQLKELVRAIHTSLENGRTPMILLKSGCLLRLWDKRFSTERAELCREPETQFYFVSSGENRASQTLPTYMTVSRRCADTERKMKSKVDYVRIFLNGKPLDSSGLPCGPVPLSPAISDAVTSAPCCVTPVLPLLSAGDNLTFDTFPDYVWWWPGKCKEDEPPLISAKLLIHLPFDLLKDFLERKGETLEKRFKQLFWDFFAHNSPKSPRSFECVAKVYRLLYDIYVIYTSSKKDNELRFMLYDIAADFATQAPEYDEEVQRNFKLLAGPDGLAKTDTKTFDLRTRHWVTRIETHESFTGEKTLLQADERKTPEDQADEQQPPLSLNRRKALYLCEDFKRALSGLCFSNLLTDFVDLHAKSGVKSEASLKRKLTTYEGEGDHALKILDYLRGTILVGNPSMAALKKNPTMLQQVQGILDTIERDIGIIERVKLEHCKKGKGFILVNIVFHKNGISIIAEIQIRIPARKSATAPPDDHIKHEVDRTFHQCLINDLDPVLACIDFFKEPCGVEFQPFFKKQAVTIRAMETGRSADITHFVESEEEKKVRGPINPRRAFEEQWKEELTRYVVFLRKTQAVLDDQVAEGLQKVWQPEYVQTQERALFLKGLKTGFKLVWEAIQRREDFKDGNFANEAKVLAWFGEQLINERKLALEEKIPWQPAETDTSVWDRLQHQVEETKQPATEEDIFQAVTSCDPPGAYVVGILLAVRFCRKNRIGSLLKNDKCFFEHILPELRKPDSKLFEGALVFGILATLTGVPNRAHWHWAQSDEDDSLSFTYIRSLSTLGQDKGKWDDMMARAEADWTKKQQQLKHDKWRV